MDIIIAILLFIGAFFILTSAIGLLRMPDLYSRLSTSSKANTFGIGAIFTALALFFYEDISAVTRSFTALVFVLITIPVSSHFLARVAYFYGIDKYKKMKRDDFEEKFGINRKVEK